MKLISAMSAVLLAAAPVAAQAPETANARVAAAFDALARFKLDPKLSQAPAVTPVLVEPAEPAVPEAKPKSSEYVTVSGQLSLNGSGFLQGHSGYVSVNFNGWTTLRDSSGRVTSNSENVSVMGSFFVNGGFVSGTVMPNVYVTLYKDGKSVGQAMVNGTIFVSGFANGNWINLNGSGTLTGSVLVSD